jgi:hypothetical protein
MSNKDFFSIESEKSQQESAECIADMSQSANKFDPTELYGPSAFRHQAFLSRLSMN